jgi:hypothetical protein
MREKEALDISKKFETSKKLMKNQNELNVIPLKPDMSDMLDLDPESQQILNGKKARTQELKYAI